MKTKQWITLLLVVMMGITSLAGLAQSEEPVELHIIARKFHSAFSEVNDILPLLEEKLNMKINIEFRSAENYHTTCQTIIASGEYPDMMEYWISIYPDDVLNLAEDGVLAPLNDSLEKYGQEILAIREPDFFPTDEEGNIWGIPARRCECKQISFMMIRQDYLDRLNLKVPTTLDELYDVLVAFKNGDPDGNGKIDTIPWGWSNKGMGTPNPLIFISSAFGATYGEWYEINGEYTYFIEDPGYREALRWLRKVYQDGLMDPECTLLDRTNYLEKRNNDKYGFETWYLDHFQNRFGSSWTAAFNASVPHAELTPIRMFADSNGERHGRGNPYTNYQMVVFNKDPKKVEACVRLLNYIGTEEGSDLTMIGIEGVNYDVVDGKIIMRNLSQDEIHASGAGLYNYLFFRYYIAKYAKYDEKLAQAIEWQDADFSWPSMLYTPKSLVDHGGDMSKLVTTYETNLMVDPNIDFDAEFDKYIAEWNKAGGALVTQDMRAEYNRRKAAGTLN